MDPGLLYLRGVLAKSVSGYDFVWERKIILLTTYETNEIRDRPQTAFSA
jgi:hypothetical protein